MVLWRKIGVLRERAVQRCLLHEAMNEPGLTKLSAINRSLLLHECCIPFITCHFRNSSTKISDTETLFSSLSAPVPSIK